MSFQKLLLVLTFLSTLAVSAICEEIYTQITVSGISKQDFIDIHYRGLDVIEYNGDSLEIIARPGDLAWLDSRGMTYQIDVPDLKELYRSHNKEALSMGGFKTFSEIVSHLDFLKLSYPTIMTSKFSLGQSIDGNEIWAVKVSDNPEIDENEPELLYISLIHAREPAAAASLLHFMEYMLSNYGLDSEVTNLVNNRELYFVPVQNPDGYLWNQATNPTGQGLWRKNRRLNADASFGVDLNRNYGFKWGYDDIGSSPTTGSEVYRGTAPFSEPETQAIRNFTIARNFVIVHNFHTYSDLELWPPGFDREFSIFDEFFKNVGDSMTQFNGYAPQVGWRLYPTNGAADDWHWGDTISKSRQISLTCEIGSTGFWPLVTEINGLINENIWPNLFLARIAENPYQVGPPMPPVAFAPDTAAKANDYAVKWTHRDTLNPAATFALSELTDKNTVIDDAESDQGYWTAERFFITNAKVHSGLFSWTEQAANRANHWLLAKTPYEVKANDSLKFWIWYNIEANWDYFYAQISTDGGFEFTNLANEMTTNLNPHNLNIGNGITGASGGWVQAKFDLSAYAGQQIIVRLSYFTDDFTLNEGIYIDDIENIDFYGAATELASGITDTFYNVVNQSPGNYWYRVTAKDAEDQTSRPSNYVGITVVLPYVPGDGNNDGSVNILDLTFMVDRIFRGGPASNPLLAADANCDNNVNVLDLTFLVDRIFRGGPAPSCPI